MRIPYVIDNQQHRLADVLNEVLAEHTGRSLDVATAYFTVTGYVYSGEAAMLSNMKNSMRGCGPFEHDDPADRPPAIFGGKVTLHFGLNRKASVLLPIVPPK